jgi:hypothetical protein
MKQVAAGLGPQRRLSCIKTEAEQTSFLLRCKGHMDTSDDELTRMEGLWRISLF